LARQRCESIEPPILQFEQLVADLVDIGIERFVNFFDISQEVA
jgi:hypothetical protein